MQLETLFEMIEQQQTSTIVVANAVDPSLFKAAEEALNRSIANFIFTGPQDVMMNAAEQASFSFKDSQRVQWLDTEGEREAAELAVKVISEGSASVLMKGMLPTPILLKAVLKKDGGLRTGRLLSHLAGFSLPGQEKMLFVTDAAMNISPDLQEKVQIIENAVQALAGMGVELPKVAVLAAVETVNPAMQATLDAAALTQMNRRQQIKGCLIDGPLGFDNAVSEESARQKGVISDVAGQADLMLVHAIESGNVLYKSLTYFGQATVGGMILGAKAPVVLTSRTDSVQSKLFSMAMALSTVKPNT